MTRMMMTRKIQNTQGQEQENDLLPLEGHHLVPQGRDLDPNPDPDPDLDLETEGAANEDDEYALGICIQTIPNCSNLMILSPK